MIDHDEAERLLETQGHLLLADGLDAGPVQRVYLDDYSGWPSFCTVHSSTAGQETFVALHAADLVPEGVHVPYSKAKLDGAPRVVEGHDLSISEEDRLFDYYGVPIDGATPVVEHLGAVLVPTPDGDVDTQPVDHPVG